MISYTTYSYNFPFSERYEKWIITYDRVKCFSDGDGYKKVSADIKPDPLSLVVFLCNNNLLSQEAVFWITKTISAGKDAMFMSLYHQKKINELKIVSSTFDFCDNQLHYSITKKGYSFSESFWGGSTNAADKAIKKIKEEIVLNYPNPARELIKYLKEKRLIDQNVNPVCDTLSKDL